jgi:hypothetical protein
MPTGSIIGLVNGRKTQGLNRAGRSQARSPSVVPGGKSRTRPFGSRSALAQRGSHYEKPVKEAVMDDGQNSAERTPQTHRFVTELEILELLNRSLWEVERQRAQEHVLYVGE